MHKTLIITEEKNILSLLKFFEPISDKIELSHICTEDEFIINSKFIKQGSMRLIKYQELLKDESIKFDILFKFTFWNVT